MSALLHAFVVIVQTAYHSAAVIFGAARGRPRAWLDRHVLAWAGGMLRGCGITVRVLGRTPESFSPPVLIMSNHRSHFDTPCLTTISPRVPVFLAKSELRRVPIMGRAMAAFGMIFLDRHDSARARAALAHAVARIQAGEILVMFPEGSRAKDGHSLSPFKKGGFHLALASGAAILPIVVKGSERILPKHSLRISSGEVTVLIGAPIPVGAASRIETLMSQTRAAMEALLAQTPEP